MRNAAWLPFFALVACGGTSPSDLLSERSSGGGAEGALVEGGPAANGAAKAAPGAPPNPTWQPPGSPESQGAIARVQLAQAKGVGTADIALPATTREGSLLVLAVGVLWLDAAATVTLPAEWRPVVSSTDEFLAATSSSLFAIEGAAPRAAGGTVRISSGTTNASIAATLVEYRGLRAVGALDRVASGSGDQTGITDTTTHADELWLALLTSRSGHGAPGDGFGVVSSQGGLIGTMTLAERIVSNVGQAGAEFSGLVLSDSAGVTATFKR